MDDPNLKYCSLSANGKNINVSVNNVFLKKVSTKEEAIKLIDDYFKKLGKPTPDLTKGTRSKKEREPIEDINLKYCYYAKEINAYKVKIKNDSLGSVKTKSEAIKKITDYYNAKGLPVPSLEKNQTNGVNNKPKQKRTSRQSGDPILDDPKLLHCSLSKNGKRIICKINIGDKTLHDTLKSKEEAMEFILKTYEAYNLTKPPSWEKYGRYVLTDLELTKLIDGSYFIKDGNDNKLIQSTDAKAIINYFKDDESWRDRFSYYKQWLMKPAKKPRKKINKK